jgi:hypothetical protein
MIASEVGTGAKATMTPNVSRNQYSSRFALLEKSIFRKTFNRFRLFKPFPQK